jgi:iron(III) transport system substrate-binding protein
MSQLTRRAALGLLGAAATGLLAACSGGGSQPAASNPTAAPAAQQPAAGQPTAAAAAAKPAGGGAQPSYYPANYADLVEASKKEQKLLVYSIMSKDNWAPVLDAFKQRYSNIDVEALDLGSYEVFERYYSESAGNARTADLIITSAPDGWQDFIKRGELVADYKSPEDDKVPAWSKLAPGIYTVSTDPMVIIWNKKLLQTPPKSMAELADMVGKNAGQYTPGKITSYEETNATGFAAYWFWAKKQGDKAWNVFETIGKTKPKLESSGGRMVDSTLSGETPLGYFVSYITVAPKLASAQEVLGWTMIADGTPLITRGMGITKKAQSPNSAKLLMDFLLSQDGQIAFSNGGLTAYRPDVADKAKIHLDKLGAEVGQDNLLPFSFDPDIADKAKTDDFRARLKTALGR